MLRHSALHQYRLLKRALISLDLYEIVDCTVLESVSSFMVAVALRSDLEVVL